MFMLAVILLSACHANASRTKDDIEYSSTQEKAIQSYIENENVTGIIDLVITNKGNKLLVTQRTNNIYFVGELIKDEKGYYAVKITPDVKLNTDMGWEFHTMNNNKYTIFFNSTENKPNFISLSNNEFKISILEGYTLSENKTGLSTAIQSIENVKK